MIIYVQYASPKANMQDGPLAVVSRVLRHHSKHKYKWQMEKRIEQHQCICGNQYNIYRVTEPQPAVEL